MTRSLATRLTLVALTFAAGAASGWALHGWYIARSMQAVAAQHEPVAPDDPNPTVAEPRWQAIPRSIVAEESPDRRDTPSIRAGVPENLLDNHIRLPIANADVPALKDHFAQSRGGGSRGHEAVDIIAPRNTPVLAVDDGKIERLFLSRQGGITIYQFDEKERYCYYYAHLERYAEGLREGQDVDKGDVIGYVGTSGNAPRDTPHLHFAIFQLTPEKRWWTGTPIDPYLVFTAR